MNECYQYVVECTPFPWERVGDRPYMNGRLYDPLVGRFLSPDNYVQSPGSTQGYNRYSYCLNNPLRYTDPEGEMVLTTAILIGVGVGALINYGIQVASNYASKKEGTTSKDIWINNIDWLDVGVSAVVGGISAGAGAGVTASTSFGKSLISFAGSKTWDYVNVLGVSLITASMDITAKDGFSFNSGSEFVANYASSMIFARTSQVSSKGVVDLSKSIGALSKKTLGKYLSGFGQNWLIGTMENVLYNSIAAPIIEKNYNLPYNSNPNLPQPPKNNSFIPIELNNSASLKMGADISSMSLTINRYAVKNNY